MQDKTASKRLVLPREARSRIPCGNTKLYGLINEGRIIAYKHGRRTMIDLDSIEAYHASLPRIVPKTKVNV